MSLRPNYRYNLVTLLNVWGVELAIPIKTLLITLKSLFNPSRMNLSFPLMQLIRSGMHKKSRLAKGDGSTC